MGKRIVTSVKIDEDIWKKTRIEAINQDMQLSESLEEALDDWIKKKKK
jgi:regulation of enolase protein 1 (concanavalin A-like superfamily)